MITEAFTVKDKNRLVSLQLFLKNNMPTARFKYEPIRYGKLYDVTITYEIDDMNKLSELQNKWHELDNKKPTKPKSIFHRIFNLT